MEHERRQFIRVKYPDDLRPKIISVTKSAEKPREREYDVVDICERGVKFESEEEISRFLPKSTIKAKISFSDGESLDIEGEVLRVSENQVVIHLSMGISASRITKEQILLRD